MIRMPSLSGADEASNREGFSVAVDGAWRFVVPAGETILRAARRAGCWLPFECGWGSCGTCKATLLEGEVRSLFPSAPAIRPQDARRRRILTCQSTPLTNVRLGQVLASSTPRPEFATQEFAGTLIERERLAPEVFLLRVALDRPAQFRAGQNAIVSMDPSVRRCYSMANAPGEPIVEFVIKRFASGLLTPALIELPLGSVIHVELPYGGAYLRQTQRPLILVAGGTGIAPMLSMLRVIASRRTDDHPPVRLFYGANRPTDLAAGDTAAALIGRLPRSEFIPTVLFPDHEWAGAVGLVTDVLMANVDNFPAYDFYVAGPPAMVEATRALLQDKAVPVTQVHYDTFG
jgi:toluene monooxygenase electron transfer component